MRVNKIVRARVTSVKRSFYHEVLSYSDAEQRLEGNEGAYLFVQRISSQAWNVHSL